MTTPWYWIPYPRDFRKRYGNCSNRKVRRMNEVNPFPLERPFGNSRQAARSDKLDEYDRAVAAAAAAQYAPIISDAEAERRDALRTQPRKSGRFVKVGKAKKPKPTEVKEPAPRKRRVQHTQHTGIEAAE
jgi:hypothetical protein